MANTPALAPAIMLSIAFKMVASVAVDATGGILPMVASVDHRSGAIVTQDVACSEGRRMPGYARGVRSGGRTARLIWHPGDDSAFGWMTRLARDFT